MKAFPTPTFSINNEARVTAVGGDGGMDLRDYFAAKAMQADMSTYSADLIYETPEWFEARAGKWYEVADAMLKAREK